MRLKSQQIRRNQSLLTNPQDLQQKIYYHQRTTKIGYRILSHKFTLHPFKGTACLHVYQKVKDFTEEIARKVEQINHQFISNRQLFHHMAKKKGVLLS